jgi:uncharacterized membrane protein YgcG
MRRLSLALILCVLAPAFAVFPPPLKDDGKFFTAKGVETANKKIREIYETHKKDVIVETLDTLTAEQEKKLKEEGTERFANLYALERSKTLGLNGVYILVMKKPNFLRIHMDPDTQKSALTSADRTKVFEKIRAGFSEDDFDKGLLGGLATIDEIFKKNLTVTPAKTKEKK